MKRSDLIESIFLKLSEESSITKSKLKRIVNSIFTYLEESLVDDDVIKIVNFGTFRKVKRKGRKGKNFKTGKPCDIPQHFTITFKVSKKKSTKGDLTTLKKG